MKVALLRAFGPPAKLEAAEIPKPTPRSGEVLIRVAACGVNRLDLMTRSGAFADLPLPHVMGSEIAGHVEAVGDGVSQLRADEAVVVAPWLFCGQCEMCARGHETVCPFGSILGVRTPGGYAEFVVVPARQVVPVQEGVSLEDAAAVALSGVTAWHMLIGRAKLEPGETVLVHGANSGIGSLAVRIAKLVGARVIATASNKSKRDHAIGIGADVVIDSSGSDWPDRVLEATAGRGADVVFEHVGEATWAGTMRCLAPRGRVVVCGATTGSAGSFDIVDLYYTEQSILGARGGTRAELFKLMQLLQTGRLEPVIDSRYELGDASAAHERMEAREQFGKILLVP